MEARGKEKLVVESDEELFLVVDAPDDSLIL